MCNTGQNEKTSPTDLFIRSRASFTEISNYTFQKESTGKIMFTKGGLQGKTPFELVSI